MTGVWRCPAAARRSETARVSEFGRVRGVAVAVLRPARSGAGAENFPHGPRGRAYRSPRAASRDGPSGPPGIRSGWEVHELLGTWAVASMLYCRHAEWLFTDLHFSGNCCAISYGHDHRGQADPAVRAVGDQARSLR